MASDPDRIQPGALPGFTWKLDHDGDWRLFIGEAPTRLNRNVFSDNCIGWLSTKSGAFHRLHKYQGDDVIQLNQLWLTTQDMLLYEAGLHVCGTLLLGGVYGKHQ